MLAVTYYRVSTAAQGRSGLGLEAQRASVEALCAARGCEIVGEFFEVESGKRSDRPELARALHRAQVTGATLVIAKLDRLSRNAAFLITLRDSGAKFMAADMPDACNLTVGVLALVAEQERDAIAARTRAALQAAKARGVKLGNPNGAAAFRLNQDGNKAAVRAVKANADKFAEGIAIEVQQLRQSGHSTLASLAKGLNARRIRTPRGAIWHPSSVRNLLRRIPA